MDRMERVNFNRSYAHPALLRATFLCLWVSCATSAAADVPPVGDKAPTPQVSRPARTEKSEIAGSSQSPGVSKKIITTEKKKKLKITSPEPVFATVNGKPIYVREHDALFKQKTRERFFHGSIPEGQAELIEKEVADELVDRELLIGEAKRRGLVPDPAKFERVLADYDARYSAEPGWLQQREQFIPELRTQVERHSLAEQMEKVIRDVPQPTPAEVRAYYEQKPELFTEPERPRLSVILLKVDPSSPQEVWNKAKEEAQGLYDRIKGGGDFAKEARLHSAHNSASNGGDMGYLHGGMLTVGLQAKVDKLAVGELSEPIKMLEGIALYRVEDRISAKLQEFSEVEKRSQELLKRDRESQSWVNTLRGLREAAKIKFISPSGIGVTKKSLQKK